MYFPIYKVFQKSVAKINNFLVNVHKLTSCQWQESCHIIRLFTPVTRGHGIKIDHVEPKVKTSLFRWDEIRLD